MNPTVIFPTSHAARSSSGRPLRIVASEATRAYQPVSEAWHDKPSKAELLEDRTVDKWAVFEHCIGKFTQRRDTVQRMRAPHGLHSVTGGDCIEVVVDQEYFFMTDLNSLAGSWLSVKQYDLGAGIMEYVRHFPAWHKHCAERAKYPSLERPDIDTL